jgi:hypothetical protein
MTPVLSPKASEDAKAHHRRKLVAEHFPQDQGIAVKVAGTRKRVANVPATLLTTLSLAGSDSLQRQCHGVASLGRSADAKARTRRCAALGSINPSTSALVPSVNVVRMQTSRRSERASRFKPSTSLLSLITQSKLSRQSRSRGRVFGGDHWIVRRQIPFLAILFWCQPKRRQMTA